MQVLLIRHALPFRTEVGEGSDPALTPEGRQQALRLPAALARFPVTRVVSSPQRRALQTAEPVATAVGLPIDVDDRLAEYDRGMSRYLPVEEIRAHHPEDWQRMASGKLPASVDEQAFLTRVRAALGDLAATSGHRDTVAVFTHGGVINSALHDALSTARLLSLSIDYASVTQLRFSRTGAVTVAGVNVVEHVWDLLPRHRT